MASSSGGTGNDFIEPEEDGFADDDLLSPEDIEVARTPRNSDSSNTKSFLERDNFETELGSAAEDPFGEDFSDISGHEIIEVFGEDIVGRPVIVIYAYRLPSNKSFDHLKFLRYIQFTLDKLVDQDYTMIYFHYGLRSNNKPPLKWLMKAYQLLDRRYKKNLKALYLMHPTKFIRFVWNIFRPFISLKFEKKVHYLNTLDELSSFVSLTNLNLPQPILDHDKLASAGQRRESAGGNSNSATGPPRPTQQFNVSLQFILDHHPNCDVPPLVTELIDFLTEHGLRTQGIFRRSAQVSSVKALQARIDLGERIDFLRDPEFDGDPQKAVIHASVLLKTFLRSMGEPVITNKLYPELALLNGVSKEGRPKAIQELVLKLPPENYQLLRTVIKFLVKVAEHSHDNLMDANNLSVVFGPNLTWPTDQQVPILQLNNLNNFCYTLIKCHNEIFTKP